MLQTPTTQLLVGEVLPGFCKHQMIGMSPRNKQGFMRCHSQLSRTHIATRNGSSAVRAAGQGACCPWEQWHYRFPRRLPWEKQLDMYMDMQLRLA